MSRRAVLGGSFACVFAMGVSTVVTIGVAKESFVELEGAGVLAVLGGTAEGAKPFVAAGEKSVP